MPRDRGADWHLFERFRSREEAVAALRQKKAAQGSKEYAWRLHTTTALAGGKVYRVEFQHRGTE
jgi:hypothetical protein